MNKQEKQPKSNSVISDRLEYMRTSRGNEFAPRGVYFRTFSSWYAGDRLRRLPIGIRQFGMALRNWRVFWRPRKLEFRYMGDGFATKSRLQFLTELTSEEFSVKKLILPIAILSLFVAACGDGQNSAGGVIDGSLCEKEGDREQGEDGNELLCQVMGDGKLVWKPEVGETSMGGGSATSSCPTPLLQTPVDLSKVTSILYPGQERGGNYKAHGGFGFDNAPNNLVTVEIPLSGKITRVVRYKEIGELQYLFEFEGDCGVSFRFDHLRKLTPKFEAVVNAFPIKEDTRTDLVSPPVSVSVGEVIATEVGFLNNVFVDFGVYDMRQKNEASKDPAWASTHSEFQIDSYGICWLNSLPQADSTAVKLLPSRDGSKNGQTSDYCK